MASIIGYTKSKLDQLLLAKVSTTRQINGKTLDQDVTLAKTDVGLGNVDNTSDVNKPVSTAQQAAFDAITKVYILASADPDPGTGAPAGLYIRRSA